MSVPVRFPPPEGSPEEITQQLEALLRALDPS